MKWLIFLFTIVRPLFFSSTSEIPNPALEFKEMIKENAMKVVAFFAAASSLATIFAGGFILIAIDIGAQFDQNGNVTSSMTIIMGLALSLVSLTTGIIVMRMFQDKTLKERHEPLTLSSIGTGSTHPLQDALALLISDFVKERELKRSQDMHSNSASYSPNMHDPSTEKTH